MNKFWLIVKREYSTRVKKRSFILTTLLTPLAFALLFVVVGVIFSYESDDVNKIAVLDEAGVLAEGNIANEKNLIFTKETRSLDELRENFDNTVYDGILLIPEIKNLYANSYTVYYYSEKNPSLDIETQIKNKVSNRIREYKIASLNLEKKQLEALDSKVELDPEPIDKDAQDSSKIAGVMGAFLGFSMGIIMYMAVFIYGMMVLRSVMEEKTSRIVEVMISSVRPFQLMLGKIVGVGAVGLTQVAIWAVLIPLIATVVNLIFGFDSSSMDMGNAAATQVDPEEMEFLISQGFAELKHQNWWAILPLFIFYFLGGYLLYSSLFAAVGSAMSDDMGESQSLTIPITIPVIIAFYIMFVTVEAPNSSLAVWSSIFPLFSPIVMPARLAFQPATWQVALSMLLLIGTSLFFVWISARIYRIGILMYGKKVSFKELGKWLFYKE
ncbi:MAG: ABC transporter permease [Saprospirales bacterium]|nr:ABC transporter permease [Saprospirales bacterium]MBK8489896.1 ABC transporter permease [Saprospirales bacterium]